jgi:seryl-tRNA synthetase
VSGALNNAAAKKYDVEAWFPGLQEFRELVSCSNCTDYQSRAMDTRFGFKKQGDREKKYVHMLNSTLTATERTICCILENYQDHERKGVVVPEALRPFMFGVDFLPFINEKPVTKEDKKKGAKGGKKTVD